MIGSVQRDLSARVRIDQTDRYGGRMQARRMFLWLVSALVAVTVVTALAPPVREATRRAESPAGPDPQSPATTPAPTRVELDPSGGEPFVLLAGRENQEIALEPGREGRIQVHSDEPVAIQIGDDGPIELAEPGTPAEFPVFGDEGLDEPIRRLDPERDIGRIRTAAAAPDER